MKYLSYLYFKMNLFLDDIRVPKDAFNYTGDTDYLKLEWVIARSYEQFFSIIALHYAGTNKLPELISFDHDLADEHYQDYDKSNGTLNYSDYKEKTGMECVKDLVEFCMDNNLKFPQYKIHSANTVGSVNMKSYIDNFNKNS